VASFNILGASHTSNSSRYATYPSRMSRAVTLMNQRKLDVVGTQEFQGKQYDYFLSKGHGNDWGACFWNPAGKKRDTENLVLFRKSTMELLDCSTFDIPYFKGNTRHVPAALLKEKATGRTFYMLNVHNPANVYGNAAKWRAQAIAIEKKKVIDLRATGRPVFITGDFNDRQAAFCPLTANKLMISPNSIPSIACAYPRQSTIDWIFGAGQVRFSSYLRDMYPKNVKISDHPIVQARAHIQH
jgi:endonuclease/exonuclease/phosphatase family metal-dependent hydrolase